MLCFEKKMRHGHFVEDKYRAIQKEGNTFTCSVSRTPFAVELPFCNTVSPGGGGPKHFPASITNKLREFS
jgi:hypothetical protein